jgi:predicted MPP superfamily phosphohydrolase
LTGDFITNQSGFNFAHYVSVLKKLAEAVPTFAVLGNHDGGAWASRRRGFGHHQLVKGMITSSGITFLHNTSTLISLNDRKLQLVGVGDLWAKEIDAKSAFSAVTSDVPTVLLSHNPDSKEVLAPYPWQLMLSGHTHGGQVVVPFCGPCFAPVDDKRYVAGLGRWRDRQIYVTRGVGNVGGVRFRCRPEISMVHVA